MFLTGLFYIIILSLYSNIFVTSISQYPVVLIISYDAFRYNYYDKGATPFLKRLRNSGTHAEYLNNVFITKTFPNHHSIATGTYPETHGVLGNSFYDPFYDRKIDYSYEMWHYSNDVLPIWIANEIKGEGRHSGIMMWPGNEFNYTGIRPTHQREWKKTVRWEERIDGAIEWILHPDKPANLVLLYIEEPDAHGHAFGPESNETQKELNLIDSATEYLLKKLTEKQLKDKINIFFVSDHGMQSVTRKNVINLNDIVPDDLYDRYENSPIAHIYPKKGGGFQVYNALKNASDHGANFKVYKTNEIPERWHYKNNRRAPPILAVADPPYVFQDFYQTISNEEKNWNITVTDDTTFGVHGYDNTEQNMKPHFLAMGPRIKENYTIEPFETVDLFSLWAHILGFPEYGLKTSGNFDRVSKMLKSSSDNSSHDKRSKAAAFSSIGGALLGVILVGTAMGIAVYFVHKKLQTRHKAYFHRYSENNFESTQRLLDNEEGREET